MKEHLKARDLLVLAAAGVLEPAEHRRLEEHLFRCEACRAEFEEWSCLAGTLKDLPTPQAPPRMVLQTQRLLKHAASLRQKEGSKLWLALLVVSSWMLTFISVGFLWLLDIPIARWLDVSSTTLWVVYIGLTWLATALAAGMIGKHWQQEGRTI
jgi:anti-sigma factor RsiW